LWVYCSSLLLRFTVLLFFTHISEYSIFFAFRPQNYEKYPFLCTKTGDNKLFFMKNLIFFDFLFVLSKDSLIFAQEK